MKSIVKSALPGLREEINLALATIAKKHNLEIRAGNASFNDREVTFKLGCKVLGEAGTALPSAFLTSEFKMLTGREFNPTEQFIHPSLGEIRIVDFKTRSRTTPWIVLQVSSGKNYRLPDFSLKAAVDNRARV